MARRIGTQHMLGGKDTFNPLCAVSLPLASSLCVSPAASPRQLTAVPPA